MKPTKRVPYVDNKRFHQEILNYKKEVEEAKRLRKNELPRMPEYIGECIYKIATKLAMKPCFSGYSFKEEMISDGIENCILYFRDYNPEYSAEKTPNPFAYFTQIIYFAFLRRIYKEERNRYITYKNFQETMTLAQGSNLLMDSDDVPLLSSTMYDNINVFMDKFEQKEEKKKEKRKQAKIGLSKFIGEDEDERPTPPSAKLD